MDDLGEQKHLLHACCKANQKECVATILDSGSDVLDIQNHIGTPMQVAVFCGQSDVVDTIMEKALGHNRRRSCFGQAQQAAAFKADLYLVNKLLSAGENVNEPGAGMFRRSLPASAKHGHERVVGGLLVAGADADRQCFRRGTALQASATFGNLSIVQLLLDAGAPFTTGGNRNIGSDRMSALASAFEDGDERIAEALLRRGARMSTRELAFSKARVEWVETYGGWRTNLLRYGLCQKSPALLNKRPAKRISRTSTEMMLR